MSAEQDLESSLARLRQTVNTRIDEKLAERPTPARSNATSSEAAQPESSEPEPTGRFARSRRFFLRLFS